MRALAGEVGNNPIDSDTRQTESQRGKNPNRTIANCRAASVFEMMPSIVWTPYINSSLLVRSRVRRIEPTAESGDPSVRTTNAVKFASMGTNRSGTCIK